MRDAGCEALVGRAVPASRWARCSTKLTTKLATKFGNGDHIDRIDLIDKRRVRPCFAKTLRRTSGRALPFFLQTQVPRPDASTPSGLTLLFFMVRKKQEAADLAPRLLESVGPALTYGLSKPFDWAGSPHSWQAEALPSRIMHLASRIPHPTTNLTQTAACAAGPRRGMSPRCPRCQVPESRSSSRSWPHPHRSCNLTP